MCSSRSVAWSLVNQSQSPLQEGCIQFYYSSTPSYNERLSGNKSRNVWLNVFLKVIDISMETIYQKDENSPLL